MAAPPFVAADLLPDGSGAVFYDAAGNQKKLYGGPSLTDFARTLPQSSMATSPEALAQAPGAGGLPGLNAQWPPSGPPPALAPPPEPPPVAPTHAAPPPLPQGGPPAPDYGAPPSAMGFLQALPEEAARANAADAAREQQIQATRAEVDRVRASKGLAPLFAAPAAPAPGEAAPGGGIGSSRQPPPQGPGRGGASFPGLDEGMGQYADVNELLDRALRQAYRGGPSHPAGYRPTTRTVQREGVASSGTQQDIEQSAQAAAAGRAQTIGAMQAGDQGTSTAYNQGALDLVNLLTQLAGTQRQAAEQGTARANDLERQAARADSPLERLLGGLNGAFAGADAISQGRDVAAAREGALNAPAAQAAALRGEAYKVRQGVTEGAMNQVRTAMPLVDALAQARARAATSGAAGAGRAGEATTALAQGDLEAARSRGAREAAQMGTSSTGEKWREAGGGGPNIGQILQIAAAKKGLGDSYANAGAVRASGKGGGEPYSVIIRGKRVPVGSGVPQGVLSQVTEQAQGISAASDALERVKGARAKLGAGRLSPDVLQGEQGGELRAAVSDLVRFLSVAEGQKSLTDADAAREMSRFLEGIGSGGAIKNTEQKLNSNATRLTRLASGMD
jgi:hypothetical protein